MNNKKSLIENRISYYALCLSDRDTMVEFIKECTDIRIKQNNEKLCLYLTYNNDILEYFYQTPELHYQAETETGTVIFACNYDLDCFVKFLCKKNDIAI